MRYADGSVDALAFLDAINGRLTFGRMLRAHRLGEEESQGAFTAQLGIGPSYLSDVENERCGVSPARAAEWARTLRHDESLFVRLALQAELDAAGIKLDVSLSKQAKQVRRRAA